MMKRILCTAIAVATFSTPSVAEVIGYQDWGDPTFGRGAQLRFSCFTTLIVQCDPSDGRCSMPVEIDPQYAPIFSGEYMVVKNGSDVEYCIDGRISECEGNSKFETKIGSIRVQERFYVGYLNFKRGKSHVQIEVPIQNPSEPVRHVLSSVDESGQELLINYGQCEVSG